MRRLVQLLRFVRVALAARTIQDFLWGSPPAARGKTWDEWLGAVQKRVDRLRVLDRGHGDQESWRIEARKRLLQLATIAVGLMEALDAAPNARFGPPIRKAPGGSPAPGPAFPLHDSSTPTRKAP